MSLLNCRKDILTRWEMMLLFLTYRLVTYNTAFLLILLLILGKKSVHLAQNILIHQLHVLLLLLPGVAQVHGGTLSQYRAVPGVHSHSLSLLTRAAA